MTPKIRSRMVAALVLAATSTAWAESWQVAKDEEGINMAKGMLTNSDKDREVWITLGQIYTRLRRWKERPGARSRR